MADLTDLLLSIADRPLAPRDSLDDLRRRGRRRARRRRVVGAAVAVGCVVMVTIPLVTVLDQGDGGNMVRVTQTPTSVAPSPASPATPAGRFVPSYLPEGLSLVSEKESATPLTIGMGPVPGRSRTYDNDPSRNGDVITISLSTEAAPLDVDLEAGRYPGARRVQVQGVAALLLPPDTARSGWVVAWMSGPGQLAQVSLNATGRAGGGGGLGEGDVLAMAERLRLPELEGTPVPAGFVLRKGQASDSRGVAPPVPRQWSALYGNISREAGDATGIAPSQANRRTVMINTFWRAGLPQGSPAGQVRGHAAVGPSAPENYRSLAWEERPGLQVSVTVERLGDDELRRVVEGLQEQSFDEVLSRPGESAAVVGEGEFAGAPYKLVASRRPTGICVELRGAPTPTGRSVACGFDPATAVLSIGVSGVTGQAAPRIVFGGVRASAKRVRVEVPGGETVEATTFAGADASYWLAALPEGKPLKAVVAMDAAGGVLERREILPEPLGAPAPPWSAAKVPARLAPAELVEAWEGNGRRDGCAALALTDLGVGAGATPRIASFGVNAWAVAFDKPGLPGTTAEGRPTADGGRSAFGIAGTALDSTVKRVEGWSDHRVWRDGSRADYGLEGGTGPKWLAQLYVRGQRCEYNVWSAVGKEHLEQLLDGIRFVEGAP